MHGRLIVSAEEASLFSLFSDRDAQQGRTPFDVAKLPGKTPYETSARSWVADSIVAEAVKRIWASGGEIVDTVRTHPHKRVIARCPLCKVAPCCDQ